MLRKRNIGAALMLLFLFMGCAGMQQPGDMSATDLSIWANRVYVMEYDSYVSRVTQGVPGEIERGVLQQKRAILTELYPLLMMYNTYLESGAIPEQALTDAIINLVYRLTEGR